MTKPSSLATLLKLRRCQRDAAHAAFGQAQRTLTLFEQRRRAWRETAAAECAAHGDDATLVATSWLEAARLREWQGADEAKRLREAVVEAERHYRAADLALEQIVQLRHRQRERARQTDARRLQHRLDDVPRPDPAHGI